MRVTASNSNRNANFGFVPSVRTNVSEMTRMGVIPEISLKTEIDTEENKTVKEITVVVENIENIDRRDIKEIAVRIEFKGEILGQSLPVPVTHTSADIKLCATINALSLDPASMDELLSNPILFTILDCTRRSSTPASLGQTATADKRKKVPLSPGETSTFPVLGYCNLEIGSLVTGEHKITETLLVEPDVHESDNEIRTWIKLPRLSVHADADKELFAGQDVKLNNTIGVTIESIYNVPEFVTNGSVFEASLPIPAVGDKSHKLVFPNGVAIMKDNFPYRKRWLPLCHLENPGIMSKHRILETYDDVFSSLPPHINLEKSIRASQRVIRWNTWRNCLMIKNDYNYFYNKLMKYNVWPLEIFYHGKSKENLTKDKSARGDKNKSKQTLSSSQIFPDHFMAFLNLSPLLHPGVKKARVAAQLFTYSYAEILSKFGSDFISDFGLTMQSQHSLPGSKRKSGSVKSKSSLREIEENASSFGMPIFDEKYAPTFIILEVELLKPLIPKRSLESLEADLKGIICLKAKPKHKATTFGLMKENFSRSLLNMVSILTEEYNNFSLTVPKDTNKPCEVTPEFEKHLQTQENFYRIKASLERAVVEIVREKYGALSQYEDKIPEIYVYLVSEMHKVTNKCLTEQNQISSRAFYNDNLQLYAEEAMEEGDYDAAKEYIFQKLSGNTSNPDYWLDYAVYCIKLKKYEEAVEAVQEALNLDFYHQIGLLMYALLTAKFLNSSVAESACGILLTKYPDFVEGWMVLSLIYSMLNNIEGEMVALQEAKKVLSTKKEGAISVDTTQAEQDEFSLKVYRCDCKTAKAQKYGVGSFVNGISCEEPLSWTTTLAPPDSIFLKTTVLLQKLGFYEYATLNLANDLVTWPKGEHPLSNYAYYSSVNQYLQGRYDEAIPVLQKSLEEFGKDCYIRSLLGHCYYKLENHARAIDCYEYVRESYNRPEDIHLIYTRMGYYHIQVNKFACAKPLLICACKYSPTPKTWKGVGIASLELGDVKDAEIAFTEANYLDEKDPETWAYLALTNALLKRLDLFCQCCLEAKKRNLKNLELVKKIKTYITLHSLEDIEF